MLQEVRGLVELLVGLLEVLLGLLALVLPRWEVATANSSSCLALSKSRRASATCVIYRVAISPETRSNSKREIIPDLVLVETRRVDGVISERPRTPKSVPSLVA